MPLTCIYAYFLDPYTGAADYTYTERFQDLVSQGVLHPRTGEVLPSFIHLPYAHLCRSALGLDTLWFTFLYQSYLSTCHKWGPTCRAWKYPDPQNMTELRTLGQRAMDFQWFGKAPCHNTPFGAQGPLEDLFARGEPERWVVEMGLDLREERVRKMTTIRRLKGVESDAGWLPAVCRTAGGSPVPLFDPPDVKWNEDYFEGSPPPVQSLDTFLRQGGGVTPNSPPPRQQSPPVFPLPPAALPLLVKQQGETTTGPRNLHRSTPQRSTPLRRPWAEDEFREDPPRPKPGWKDRMEELLHWGLGSSLGV